MLVKSAAVAPGHSQDSQKANRTAIRSASRVIKDERPGLTFERYFTRQGVDPFETVEWESRDAVISGADAAPILARLIPGGDVPARAMRRFPGATEAGYTFISRHRGTLGRIGLRAGPIE